VGPTILRYVAPVLSTSGSALKSASHPCGKSAATSPIDSVTPAAIAAPVHATRRARASRPAPKFVPTIVTRAEPKPKTSGIWRYSRRTPMPYPASAKVPKDPTSAVRRTMVKFVWTLLTRLASRRRVLGSM